MLQDWNQVFELCKKLSNKYSNLSFNIDLDFKLDLTKDYLTLHLTDAEALYPALNLDSVPLSLLKDIKSIPTLPLKFSVLKDDFDEDSWDWGEPVLFETVLDNELDQSATVTIPKNRHRTLKRYNGQRFGVCIGIINNEIFAITSEHDEDVIREIPELLEFVNLYLDKPLSLNPLLNEEQPSIDALIKSIRYTLNLDPKIKSSLDNIPEKLIDINTWLRYDTAKNTKSGLCLVLNTTSCHPHLNDIVVPNFTHYFLTNVYWLNGHISVLRENSHPKYFISTTSEDPNSNQNLQRLFEHFFLDALGSNNLLGDQTFGSGAFIELNLSELLKAKDFKLCIGQLGRYYVYTDNGYAGMFGLEYKVDADPISSALDAFLQNLRKD